MKREEKINFLRAEIEEKAIQLEKLNAHVDKSNICSDLYNKVVLEKATLNKELQDLENDTLISRIRQIIPRKKILICDYFKK